MGWIVGTKKRANVTGMTWLRLHALLALVLLAGALGGHTLKQAPDDDGTSRTRDCQGPVLLAVRLRLETARNLGARVTFAPGSTPPEPDPVDPVGGSAAANTTLVLSAAAECRSSVRQDQAAVKLAVRVRAELQVRVPESLLLCLEMRNLTQSLAMSAEAPVVQRAVAKRRGALFRQRDARRQLLGGGIGRVPIDPRCGDWAYAPPVSHRVSSGPRCGRYCR